MNDASRKPQADVGVFGGSGFYRFADGSDAEPGEGLAMDAVETVKIDTAWGAPSGPLTLGSFGDADPVRVAFLARHGVDHEYPAHRVNFRANVDAMRQLGVRALVAPFAAGSLRPEVKPGEFVVVDQLVDRTNGRVGTFYDHFDSGPVHIPFADPYDAKLRQTMVDVARSLGIVVHDGGTVVVVNGPRFSTRAESEWHRAAGWHVVNMTQAPEAALAREAGIPFVGIALVTDYDAGLKDVSAAAVTQEMVFEVFKQNLHRVRQLVLAAIPALARKLEFVTSSSSVASGLRVATALRKDRR
ncbi:MAG: MTAP family purine nucleoside phosphorylase, partial [Stackebrandtia sp.]